MNEQTPTWSCPVCYRRIDDWEDLFVDGYFTEMLFNTPKHIDTVRVEPNGHVTIIDENPDLANNDDSEEEEDISQVDSNKAEVTILLDDDDDEDNDNEQQQVIVQKTVEESLRNNTNTVEPEAQAVIATPSVPTTGNNDDNNIPFSDSTTMTPTKRMFPYDDSDNQSEPKEQTPRRKQKTNIIDLTLDSEDELDDPFTVLHEEVGNNSTR
jgi:hypothetical protein